MRKHVTGGETDAFHTVLNYSREGVQVVDMNGIIRYINPAFTDITGVPAANRIGFNVFEVSPKGALSRLLATKQPVLHWKNKVKDTGVEVISNAVPIYSGGRMNGAVVIFRGCHPPYRKKGDETPRRFSLHGHRATFTFDDIVGESRAIGKTVRLAKKAAATKSTVLLTGESGTGKELFAQAIHNGSVLKHRPFVAVNCAAIPENLLESELFGHEKGAFTHAAERKKGKVELAEGGTLFLDEIGEMSPHLQAKLLRMIQCKQFERIGGLKPIRLDIRMIAATNRDPRQLMKEGKFREDLYYRLNVLRIDVPPLRERPGDIPLLIEHLMDKIRQKTGLNVMGISEKTIRLFRSYHWPGNVRELENVLERVMHECDSSIVTDALVQRSCEEISTSFVQDNEPDILPLKIIERNEIQKALRHFGDTVEGKKKAALALGISLATLYNKIKLYGLEG